MANVYKLEIFPQPTLVVTWLQAVCQLKNPLTKVGLEKGGVNPAPLSNVAHGGFVQSVIVTKSPAICPPVISKVTSWGDPLG